MYLIWDIVQRISYILVGKMAHRLIRKRQNWKAGEIVMDMHSLLHGSRRYTNFELPRLKSLLALIVSFVNFRHHLLLASLGKTSVLHRALSPLLRFVAKIAGIFAVRRTAIFG